MPDLNGLSRIVPVSASRPWIEDVLDISTSDLTPEELVLARKEAHRIHSKTPDPPRHFKVHDRYDPTLFPPEATAGIVYIVRDPRDVALSYAEHRGSSLDETIEIMSPFGRKPSIGLDYKAQTPQVLSSWSDHTASWLDQKSSPILLLRYEDMCRKPIEQFGRLAAFLGLNVDSATLRRAVEVTHFDVLYKLEETNGFPERPRHMERFFRRGTSGNWARDLGKSQQNRILTDHEGTMARFGYLRNDQLSS
jgi:aryl sulfotransferase